MDNTPIGSNIDQSDITDRNDIVTLVDCFYEKVLVDDTIGFLFTEVAQIQMEHHMPIMYNFWESMLLGNMVYKGNPMTKHIVLDQKTRLEQVHFDRWITLFKSTIDAHFSGPKANEAKERATSIALLMQHQIKGHRRK